jgi:hypothetical protein
VGKDAFATFSLLCPDRFVLGVPHCTGRYSAKDFDGLFDDKARLRPQFVERLTEARAKDKNGALWLTPAKARTRPGKPGALSTAKRRHH